jgi:lantibiotic biosynthesis dehydratase-like protein
MNDASRRALVVVYYDDRKRDLLRDCLVGVTRRLQATGGIATAYLRRHWLRGPHVRICLTCPSGRWPEPELAAARAEVERHLAAHPSTTVLDEAAYLARSVKLGAAEFELPPYGPLWPNNTVQLVPVEEDGAMLGSLAALDAKEDLMHRAVDAIEASLPYAAPASRRLDLCWRLLTVAAAGYPNGGLLSGQMSLRSHVEEYLVSVDPHGRLRDAFTQRVRAVSASVLPEFRELVTACETKRYTGPDPTLRRWQAVLDHGLSQAVGLVQRDEFVSYGDTRTDHLRRAELLGEEVLRWWRRGDDRPYSEFHQLLRRLTHRPEGVDVVEFGAFRFVLNHVYALLPLLDVSPLERYFSCLLVSTLTEAVFETSSVDLIRKALA